MQYFVLSINKFVINIQYFFGNITQFDILFIIFLFFRPLCPYFYRQYIERPENFKILSVQDDCKPQILCGMRIESPPASRLYKTPFLSRCRTIPKCAGYIIKIILYFTTLNWYLIHWTADNQEASPMTYDNLIGHKMRL